MGKTTIKKVRLLRGLTQSDLAAQVGVSARKIARLEAGIQPCRLGLARELAKALDAPIERLFPRSKKLLDALPARNYLPSDEQLQALLEVGLDIDARYWSVNLRVRGGRTISFEIDGGEFRRLFDAVQRISDLPTKYVVFDSEDRRIAVNLDLVPVCHFTFEAFNDRDEPEPECYEGRLLLADGSEEMTFSLEPDRIPREEDDVQELENIFYKIATWGHDGLIDPLICHFEDVDGEDVFFRMEDAVVFSVPLEAAEPAALEELADNDVQRPPAARKRRTGRSKQSGNVIALQQHRKRCPESRSPYLPSGRSSYVSKPAPDFKHS